METQERRKPGRPRVKPEDYSPESTPKDGKPKVIFQCVEESLFSRLPQLQVKMTMQFEKGGVIFPGESRSIKPNAACQYVVPRNDKDYEMILEIMHEIYAPKYHLVEVGAEQENRMPKRKNQLDFNQKKMEAALEQAAQSDDLVKKSEGENKGLRSEIESLKRELAKLTGKK